MKTISFMKMAGAGNDFIVVDALKGMSVTKIAQQACDRTNGIGADGLLILDTSKTCDYRMRIINADGSEAEMCGNGARCMAAYIVKTRKPKKKLFTIETLAGEIRAEAKGEKATVRLSDPTGYRARIPLELHDHTLVVSFINTGVPHAVIYVSGLEDIAVKNIGAQIRYHQTFEPKGTNVNFVEQKSPTLIDVRTYERGVEDETKACGTGSVASAIVTYVRNNQGIKDTAGAEISVRTRSGEILDIRFDIVKNTITNVWLTGSARFIAHGEYYYT